MTLILILFIFTLTHSLFHCCSCCCYGICIDILTLIAFCISHYFIVYVVPISVQARLSAGFFLTLLRFFPGTLCGPTSA